MKGSTSRLHEVQPTRRSARLKSLQQVYESDVKLVDGSSEIQKYDNNADSGLRKPIKTEMMETEDETFLCKPREQVESYTSGTSDDQIDIPLKVLRKRCRKKTQNFLKGVSDVKVKQEEPDLEEPIINLKRRNLKGSIGHNKRRKSAFISLDPLVSTSSSCQLADTEQGCLLAIKDNTSTEMKVSEDTTHVDSNSTGGTHFLEDGAALVLKGDPICADVHKTFCHAKTDIVESSLNYQTEANHVVSATSMIGLLQKHNQISSTNLSMDECHKASSNIHVDSPIYNIVVIKNHDLPEEFFNSPLVRPDEDVFEDKQLPPMPNKFEIYQADGESREDTEPENNRNIHDIGKEHISLERDNSSLPNQNNIPSVSEAMRASPDSCNEEVVSTTMETNLTNRSKNETQRTFLLDEVTRGIEVEESNHPSIPICFQVKDVTNTHNLQCKEVYGLAEIFLQGNENSCCELINDASTNSLESVPSSQMCFSAMSESCSSVESSSKVESFCKVENNLTEQADKGTNSSSRICNSTNSDGLAEPNAQSSTAAPLFANASGIPQYTNDTSVKDTENSNYVVGEKLDANSNLQTMSSISIVVETRNEQPKCDEEMLEDHSPIKLLSYRKTISPTSQEKLCQALSDIGLQDDSQLTDSPEKRKSLLLDKLLNVKKPSCIPSKKESELLMHHDHANKKPWDHSNVTPVGKTTLKFQEISGKMPSTTDMDMEKIIEFSERQMHDIERIATQLLKKLNTMKTIAETTVTSQAQSFLNASFATEEIKAATEDASELEKTTKKWLSIMKKDCIRFCKIIRSTDNKSTFPSNGTQKKRRITFADEVGGKLCHVKVFEQQPPPSFTLPEQAD
ncbi:uncharacterized protein LOC122046676 isoform X2 [Zingiber officinale]|uniref:uncharacterized protein LOC122046676 isoform X2 n=1 Tax=Zingiber officinale TaxID=94328 RepID=UPI001C4B0BA2|nr:uncharacterized protein LOC122046676 isoform X2 [Zingiber officinale]